MKHPLVLIVLLACGPVCYAQEAGNQDPLEHARAAARMAERRAAELQRAMEPLRALAGMRQNPVRLERAAFLGVSTSPVPEPLREQLRLPKGFGLLVDHVEKNSPADAAGIKQYDVIQKLDDQMLVNAQQLATLLRSHKAGDEVRLTVIHQGQSAVIPVKLAEKELRPLDDAGPWMIAPRLLLQEEQNVPLEELMGNFWKPLANKTEKRVEIVIRPAEKEQPFRDLEQYIHRKLSDGDVTVSVSRKPDEPATLTLKDKTGRIIYQRPVDDDLQKALPEEVQKLLERFMSENPDAPRPGRIPGPVPRIAPPPGGALPPGAANSI